MKEVAIKKKVARAKREYVFRVRLYERELLALKQAAGKQGTTAREFVRDWIKSLYKDTQ
jgi:hypothetical protein